jgi:hypothetical protein
MGRLITPASVVAAGPKLIYNLYLEKIYHANP